MLKKPAQLFGLLLLACCAAAPVPKPAPAPAPDPLAQEAAEAAVNGSLAGFTKRVETQLEPLLDPHTHQELEQLTRLAGFREFGRYFARLPKGKLTNSQRLTLQWLANKPRVLNTLMMAVGKTDSPDQVLQVLEALYLDMGDRLEEWPDLTAAICVVWDSPARRRNQLATAKLDVSRPRLLMRYYTNAHDQLRYDPQRLPWQLLVYVVDNIVSEGDIAWALDRYSRRSNIGATYFDVPYDYNAFYGSGGPQDAAKGRAYSLRNLVTFGGVCADQAYFASQVGRIVGVPAAPAAGQSGNGAAPHAWVGYLDVQGDRAEWNFLEGRYPEYRFFKGRVVDPQTREGVTESDVSLSAELWDTPSDKRAASIALCKVSDLIGDARKAANYMQAINLSPGNRDAWLALADLASKNKLTDQQMVQLKEVVARFAVRKYPDFAFAVLGKSVSGKGNAQQLEALDEIGKLFDQTRPDLLAALDAAKGDLYYKSKHPTEALAMYGEAIERYGSSGAIAVELMDHVDKLLRETGELNRLADIYQYIWQHQPQPEPSAYVQITPFYMLGERYEEVLKELGETSDVQTVRARLDSLRASSKSMNREK